MGCVWFNNGLRFAASKMRNTASCLLFREIRDCWPLLTLTYPKVSVRVKGRFGSSEDSQTRLLLKRQKPQRPANTHIEAEQWQTSNKPHIDSDLTNYPYQNSRFCPRNFRARSIPLPAALWKNLGNSAACYSRQKRRWITGLGYPGWRAETSLTT